MKAIFNFQIKMDDRQTAVLFGMEECKGVDIEVMSNLTKLFSETKTKSPNYLKKAARKNVWVVILMLQNLRKQDQNPLINFLVS